MLFCSFFKELFILVFLVGLTQIKSTPITKYHRKDQLCRNELPSNNKDGKGTNSEPRVKRQADESDDEFKRKTSEANIHSNTYFYPYDHKDTRFPSQNIRSTKDEWAERLDNTKMVDKEDSEIPIYDDDVNGHDLNSFRGILEPDYSKNKEPNTVIGDFLKTMKNHIGSLEHDEDKSTKISRSNEESKEENEQEERESCSAGLRLSVHSLVKPKHFESNHKKHDSDNSEVNDKSKSNQENRNVFGEKVGKSTEDDDDNSDTHGDSAILSSFDKNAEDNQDKNAPSSMTPDMVSNLNNVINKIVKNVVADVLVNGNEKENKGDKTKTVGEEKNKDAGKSTEEERVDGPLSYNVGRRLLVFVDDESNDHWGNDFENSLDGFFSKELHSDQFEQDKEHNVNVVDFIRNSVKAVKNPVFPASENDGGNVKEKTNGHENSMINNMVKNGMIDERGKSNNDGNIDFLKKTVKAVQYSPEGNTGSGLKRDDRNLENVMLGDQRENYFAVDSNMDHFIQEQKNKGSFNFLKKAVKGIKNGPNEPATAYDLNLYSNYENNLRGNARPRAKIGAAGLFPDSNLVLHNEGQKSMDNGYISTAKGAKEFPDVSILFKNPISRVADESNGLRKNEYDSLARADALAPRRQVVREATTLCASTEGSASTTMGRPEAQTPSSTQAAVTGGTVARTESSVTGSSATEKYVSENNTNSTQYDVEDEKLMLSIANKVSDAIFAQASAYSSLRNGLGICRKSNLNDIKGSKELKEQGSDEVVGQIIKCVTNLLKSHVGNQKCMAPDEPLHEFLVWMVRTGDPMHTRWDVAPKQDLSKSEFLFPTMCNDTAANKTAASRPLDHKVAYM